MSKSISIRALAICSKNGQAPVLEDHVVSNQERGIFMVADGFGGGKAGAETAKETCHSVLEFLEKEAGDMEATLPFVLKRYYSLAGNVIFNAVVYANQKIWTKNQNKSGLEKAGTSVVAGFLDKNLLALANVGSCSASLIRGGQITQLVVPRTYARLCNPFIEPSQDPVRVPLMAVGLTEELEPEIVEYRIQPGDWLILHSDGMSQYQAELLELSQRGLEDQAAISAVKALLRQDCLFITHRFYWLFSRLL